MLSKDIKLPFLPDKIQNREGKTYNIKEYLGKGGFAFCYRIEDKNEKSFVVKVQIKYKSQSIEEHNKLENEAKIQESLDHDNICQVICSFQDKTYVYIILEYCMYGSLQEMLNTRKKLSEWEARYILYHIILAVSHCHNNGIIHRDIKPDNILLGDNNSVKDSLKVKLSDFGLAADVKNGNSRHTFCGTSAYRAPEVLSDQSYAYSFPVDIWSIGILYYRLVSGVFPFNRENKYRYVLQAKSQNFGVPQSLKCSKGFLPFIKYILKYNPKERPTIKQILACPYLTTYIPKALPKFALYNEPSFTSELYSYKLDCYSNSNSKQDNIDTTKNYCSIKKLLNKKRKSSQNQIAYKKKPNFALSPNMLSLALEAMNDIAISLPNNLNFPLFKHVYNYIKNIDNLDNLEAVKEYQGFIECNIKLPVFVRKNLCLNIEYGTAYELTNGVQAMIFANGTTLACTPELQDHHYQYINLESSNGQIFTQVTCYPYKSELNLNMDDDKAFYNNRITMSSDIMESNIPIKQYESFDPKLYVLKIYRISSHKVFRLSSDNIQINFPNKTKIILSEYGRVLHLIKHNSEIYSFNTIELVAAFNRLEGYKDIYDDNVVTNAYFYLIQAEDILIQAVIQDDSATNN